MAVAITLWKSKLIKTLLGACCSYLIVNAIFSDGVSPYSPTELIRRGRYAPDSTFSAIQNETLGFERVFAIGLKERTDKRDLLTLAASTAGFHIDWLEGVKPDAINSKNVPAGFDLGGKIKPNVAACWRAHMDAMYHVVANKISSALILEDDVDWDVSIKQQLQEFARGVRTLTGNNMQGSTHSPYGDGWDFLWVGGCSSSPETNGTEFYAILNDPTVPRQQHRGPWDGTHGPPPEWFEKYPDLSEDTTRFIYRARTGCCLYGYAVTYEGAKKILAELSVGYLDCAVDNAMGDMCEGKGRPRLHCYAPFPNLFGTHRRAGSSAKDSDIETWGADNYHEAEAWNMVYSTKLNLNRLIAGGEVVNSQWEKGYERELNLREFQYPQGLHVSD